MTHESIETARDARLSPLERAEAIFWDFIMRGHEFPEPFIPCEQVKRAAAAVEADGEDLLAQEFLVGDIAHQIKGSE
tara:strand:- start:519 stop:749 length:231 start_codon:yes stop_codon:yes gene_type:complete